MQRSLFRAAVTVVTGAVVVAFGCAPAEDQPAEDPPAAATTVSLADLAGTWTVTATTGPNDSVLITYEMYASSTRDGWTTTLPGREPMPVRVVLVDGDSVVAEAGPFESALRPGVTVSTRTVARLQGNMLMGTILARYANAGADSILTGRIHGMRKAP